MKSILLSGVGGQGTVLASKLLAQAAMNKGLEARSAETIGMAQRGGCVVSHIRMGEDIASPMIPLGQADVLMGFEPAEALRTLPYLKPEGCVIVSPKAIQPITATVGSKADVYDGIQELEYLKCHAARVIVVDGDAICAACQSSKVLNVAMLGALAASGCADLTLEEMAAAIDVRVPEKFREMNKLALRLGAEAVPASK